MTYIYVSRAGRCRLSVYILHSINERRPPQPGCIGQLFCLLGSPHIFFSLNSLCLCIEYIRVMHMAGSIDGIVALLGDCAHTDWNPADALGLTPRFVCICMQHPLPKHSTLKTAPTQKRSQIVIFKLLAVV
mgnify:CR=1 FL=1